jgi:hypothetical protein
MLETAKALSHAGMYRDFRNWKNNYRRRVRDFRIVTLIVELRLSGRGTCSASLIRTNCDGRYSSFVKRDFKPQGGDTHVENQV